MNNVSISSYIIHTFTSPSMVVPHGEYAEDEYVEEYAESYAESQEVPVNQFNSQSINRNGNYEISVMHKILEMVTEIKIQVNDIARNMQSFKVDKQPVEQYDIFTKCLPLNSFEAIEKFEELISDLEINKLFKTFLTTIGGNDYKDNINRVYKILFTNELGMGCSWLGQRNNKRMVDLKIIAAVKEIIIGQHNIQQKLIENCSSEWFRHARQRYQREKK
ncbi:uncharacterized protein LOC116182897 isoform X1 [Photinus pyralis]|nr:uncharacterized protein LOC116160800 isoform X1 [Photinus pyralis]XP_031359315.1 uncharacterized protein LOC116182897 isoform X1 [Photinus pyralis]